MSRRAWLGMIGVCLALVCNCLASGTALAVHHAALNRSPDRDDVTLFATAYPSIRWRYYNPGDYNQDGEVNSADLTELARHFGEKATDRSALSDPGFSRATIQSVVDGDDNGEINLADITVIARNFHKNGLGGFSLTAYPPVSSTDSTLNLGPVPFSATLTSGLPTARKLFGFEVPAQLMTTPDYNIYVQLLDATGASQGPEHRILIPAPIVTDDPFTRTFYEDGKLSWLYFNQCDANQDGTVEWDDLDALKGFWMKTWDINSFSIEDATVLADFDLNGQVNTADIGRFPSYLGRNVRGYNVYYSADVNDYPGPAPEPQNSHLIGRIPLNASGGTTGDFKRRTFSYTLAEPPLHGYYWVRPYGYGGWVGPDCGLVSVEH